MQNDPLFRAFCGMRFISLRTKWVSVHIFDPSTTLLRPGVGLKSLKVVNFDSEGREGREEREEEEEEEEEEDDDSIHLRELCFANECLPVLRRVSKRLGSSLACSARPGTTGHNRARPGPPQDRWFRFTIRRAE